MGVLNATPSSSSSTWSPASEPVLAKLTRKVVVTDSAAFIMSPTRSVLVYSASVGALGARVSSIKVTGGLAGLTLSAASVIWAVKLLVPSTPSSVRVTVKST